MKRRYVWCAVGARIDQDSTPLWSPHTLVLHAMEPQDALVALSSLYAELHHVAGLAHPLLLDTLRIIWAAKLGARALRVVRA